MEGLAGIGKVNAQCLKIALVHAADAGGGAEQCVVSLHRGLREMGHECRTLVGQKHTQEPGVEQIAYWRGWPGSRRLARWVEEATGAQDIYNPSFRAIGANLAGVDAVHFHTLWGSAGYADIAALPRLTKTVPSLLTLHDTWFLSGHCACFHACERWRAGCGVCPSLGIAPAIPKDATRFNWERKRRIVARSQLRVIGVSDWVVSQARNSPIFQHLEISRIYNGIDTSVFNRMTASNREIKRIQLGIRPDQTVVLLAGQTVEGINSGIAARHAIAALNALNDRSSFCALIIGKSAASVATRLKMSTICLPFQTLPGELAEYYAAADVTLVASEVETFGRIAAESMACGTPVVTFDSGGLPEVVEDGVTGIVVPCGHAEGLTNGISLMQRDSVSRAAYGAAARARVVRLFSQNVIAQQHANLYQSLIDSRRREHG